MKLTPRQEAFALYYIQLGSTEQAALKAGYSATYARKQSHKLLANVGIQNIIEEANNKVRSDRIADVEEIKTFWTNVLRSEEEDLKDRLKASEYLAKTNALFVDKVEQRTTASVSVKSDLDNLSVEELEKIEQILSKPK